MDNKQECKFQKGDEVRVIGQKVKMTVVSSTPRTEKSVKSKVNSKEPKGCICTCLVPPGNIPRHFAEEELEYWDEGI